MQGDGELFARTVDATGVSHTSDLGPGLGADLISGGANPVLLTTATSGQQLIQYNTSTNVWSTLRSLPGGGVTACGATANQVGYVTTVSNSVTTLPRSGATGTPAVKMQTVPTLSPDPAVSAQITASAAIQSLYARASAPGQQAPTITQLVPGLDGDMYALTANNYAAGVVDLSTGKSGALAGWSWVDGGCLGGDGCLYAVGEAAGKGAAEAVYRLDPQTLTAQSTAASLGWTQAPVNQPPLLDRLWTLPTSNGVLIAAVENNVNNDPSGSPGPLEVWSAGPTGARKLCEVPNATGMKVGFGGDSNLLLFCGPAKNLVSSLDPTTGAVTPLPDMTAPAGSYVVVAAR
jgi:hypothetical protein